MSVVIADKEKRNKGIGSEAIRLMLNHAFNKYDLHKVESRVNAKNVLAVNCYKNIGFEIEGRMRDHLMIGGEYTDLVQMGILRNEFMRET